MISTDIRNLLRSKEHEDGLTVAEIAALLRRKHEQIGSSITEMPDSVIDRWRREGHQDVAVWSVVVPVHCPRPERKRKATA